MLILIIIILMLVIMHNVVNNIRNTCCMFTCMNSVNLITNNHAKVCDITNVKSTDDAIITNVVEQISIVNNPSLIT